jgi:A/G-specific adenine glycosylase
VTKTDVAAVDAAALETWFRESARDLPWRRRRTGYTGLVSEAMLQQTQVERVRDRYAAFMRRFPTVRTLAEADEQEVLAAWQGLGYYRRARNLHAAARMIMADFAGRVPRTADELRRLPGVGRYTAGAIASIVYGERTPLVDGNVQRVLARWFGDERAPSDPAALRWAWKAAEALVERAGDPGVFNEALMELGATVCTPKSPSCEACPMAGSCNAHRTGRADEIPPPRVLPDRTELHFHTVLVRRGTKLLFEQRASDGLWSRMWQTPTIEAPRPLRAKAVGARLPVPISDLTACGSFVHHTTHRHITFHVFTATSRARRGTWRVLDDIVDLPMSNAQRRVFTVAEEPALPFTDRK